MGPYSYFNAEKDFHYGACGGVLIIAPYNWTASGQSAQNQIDFIKSMAMITYRFTATPINDQGIFFNSSVEDRMVLIAELARDQGIVLLPIIPGRYLQNRLWEAPAAESYEYGYNIANGFVTNYGHLFPYKLYELANEIELFWDLLKVLDANGDVVQPPTNIAGPGTSPGDFNIRLDSAIQYIAGMEDGVKAADPEAKTMFDVAGHATYLMDRVIGTGPFFWSNHRPGITDTVNYTSWHWYNNSQRAWERGDGFPGQGESGANDIAEYVWLRYGKEIWFTETNYRFSTGNTQAENEQSQVDWFDEFYSICKKHPYVKGYYIFQLFDREDSSFQENNFGLYKFEGSGWGNPVPKTLAQLLQTV